MSILGASKTDLLLLVFTFFLDVDLSNFATFFVFQGHNSPLFNTQNSKTIQSNTRAEGEGQLAAPFAVIWFYFVSILGNDQHFP